MQLHKNPVFIGTVLINPDQIGAGGEYIFECPLDSKVLSTGALTNGSIVLWLAAPYAENPRVEKRRLYVVPGGQPVNLSVDFLRHIGTVILPSGSETGGMQDWHVFSDSSGATIDSVPHSSFALH
jgi:hypothetical protein